MGKLEIKRNTIIAFCLFDLRSKVDKETAATVGELCMIAANKLADTIPIMKEKCDTDQYEIFSAVIGSVIYDIHEEIICRLAIIHPDIREEIDKRFKTKLGEKL